MKRISPPFFSLPTDEWNTMQHTTQQAETKKAKTTETVTLEVATTAGSTFAVVAQRGDHGTHTQTGDAQDINSLHNGRTIEDCAQLFRRIDVNAIHRGGVVVCFFDEDDWKTVVAGMGNGLQFVTEAILKKAAARAKKDQKKSREV